MRISSDFSQKESHLYSIILLLYKKIGFHSLLLFQKIIYFLLLVQSAFIIVINEC